MRWDPQTDTVFYFAAPRIPGEPSDDLVSAFAEDKQGNIWIGLHKGGLVPLRRPRFPAFPGARRLKLLTEGHQNKTAAAELGISSESFSG